MHMTFLDWLVVAAVLGMFISIALYANRMTKSVADYLVAAVARGDTCSPFLPARNG